jgi:predicted Zn-dependent peptidase
LLRASDLDLERNVVLEEISTVEDTPDDLVFELFSERLWPEHPYGYSILGTRDTVSALGPGDLQALHRAGYYRGNCVVAAAGCLQHDRVLELLEHEGWFAGGTAEPPLPPVASVPAVRGADVSIARDSNQTHLVFGSDTFPYRDRRRFALSIVTNVFRGRECRAGCSSRSGKSWAWPTGSTPISSSSRPRELRECTSVPNPATAAQAEEAIRAQYRRLANEGLPADELASGKQQLKGQLMLSLESPASRMNRLASITLHGEPYRNLEALLAEIDAVTVADVAALTAEYFDPDRQTVVRLGPN